MNPRPAVSDARTPVGAFAAVLGTAIALRLWHVAHGLPDLLEEAIPLHLALERVNPANGAIDWNPHDFHYPSLSIYLHLFLQLVVFGCGKLVGTYRSWADYVLRFDIDPTPMVIPARLLGIACDALAILGVMRIARRLAGGSAWLAGGLAALAPTLIVTSRSIFCDSLMAVAAVWAVERMLAWTEGHARRDLVLAAALVGLAAGAKYPAAVLLLPLLFVLVRERGLAGARSWIPCAALAGLVFVATTPYALLSPAEFLRDFSFESGHAAGGHLGSMGRHAFLFYARGLVTNLGWGGLAVLGASWLDHRAERAQGTRLAVVWLAFLAFAVPISLARIDADRYLVPVVLLAVPLVATGAFALFARATMIGARGAAVASLVLPALLLVGVALPGGRAASAGGDTTTQVAAREWCEAHVRRSDVIVQEGYSARLPSVLMKANLRLQPVWQYASAATRAVIDSIPAFHAVSIPLQVAGNVAVPVRDADGRERLVEILPHASLLDRDYYDPRLFAGADYLMTSSAVRGRFEADASRYPVEHDFYRFLDAHATTVAQFAEGPGMSGPEIRVYRIDERFRAAADSLGELPLDWWQAAIPAVHRPYSGGVYEISIRPYVSQLANEYAVAGHAAAARRLAEATLAAIPGDLDAAAVLAISASRLGDWQRTAQVARAVLATPQPAAIREWFTKLRDESRQHLDANRVELASHSR